MGRRNQILVKRIYSARGPEDGYRVLVDRLWPRGIKKEQAHIDLWLREIAPSNALRIWFQHDPEKWATFKERYGEELDNKRDLVTLLTSKLQHGPVTLLYGAKHETCNQAVALKDYLLKAAK